MRKTLVLQHVCGPKWLSKREHFPLIKNTFPFEVLKVFLSSLLGIQVMAFILVFSHSLTL